MSKSNKVKNNKNTVTGLKKAINEAGASISEGGKKLAATVKDADYSEITKKVAKGATDIAVAAKDKATSAVQKVSNSTVELFDENGNGEIDIEDVIIKGMRTPGVRINRDDFLRKELYKKYSEKIIEKAVKDNPMTAGIPLETIDEIADEVIQYERNCVSGISAALGVPGGIAMAATIPADIAQYYGYLLRATQKLLYLYGFPQIDLNEENTRLDSETINILIICMGIMYGTAGANNALKAIAKALATGVEKKLLKTALTKGTIYPIVKSVASWFGKKMTKDIFAGFFKKSIPVVGGVLGGGITYLSFKPCCERLKASLRDTRLSNPDYVEEESELQIVDAEYNIKRVN